MSIFKIIIIAIALYIFTNTLAALSRQAVSILE